MNRRWLEPFSFGYSARPFRIASIVGRPQGRCRYTTVRTALAAIVAYGAAATWIAAPGAQTQKADWLTDGGDPQRTAWQRNETILTKDNVKDMKLLWTIALDNQTRQMHNLFPPLVAGSVATPAGEKEIAVVAGVSDNLYAI